MGRIRSYRDSAFSLIELTIALAIVGILSSVAIGRFGGFAGRARRIEAHSFLAGVAAAQLANRFTTSAWACSFDELYLTADGTTRVSASELRGTHYTFQMSCDPDGNYLATATGNTDGDGWLDVAIASPVTRFALQYDDIFDTYDPTAGAVAAATATPAPSATSTPVSATPAPTATPTPSSGNEGNGNNGKHLGQKK